MKYNHKIYLSFTKFFTGVLLFVFFALAYIVNPYWTTLPSLNLKIAYWLIFLLGGLVWVYLSSSPVKVNLHLNHVINFFLVLILASFLNINTLTSVIPWRGDEDFHILLTNYVVTMTPNRWFLYGGFLIGLILLLAWKKSFWVFPIGVLFLLAIFVSLNSRNPYQGDVETFLRYPFINYWFYSFTPKLSSFFGSFHYEFLFRFPTFLTVIILVALILSKLKHSFSFIFSTLWGLALLTIPILFYYTSILYLEMPIILLLFTIANNINVMLQSNYDNLKQIPSWYSLLGIGFIKETVIPFLICFLIARWIVVIINRRGKNKYVKANIGEMLLQELLIAFSVLFPALLYLSLRIFTATNIRPYEPFINNLVDLQIYFIEAKALITQFGMVLLIFLAATISAFYKKRFVIAIFWLFSIVVYFVFFAMDQKIYIGYSRFNLFFLPVILVGAVYFLKIITRNKYKLSLMTASIVLTVNLFTSPINLDGTKKPYWNNYLINLSEKYYPFEDALIWIKEKYPHKRILFTGLTYPYTSLSFYFEKLDWHPRMNVNLMAGNQKISVIELLSDASEDGFDVVMIPVINSQDIQPENTVFYKLEMVSMNQAYAVLIYVRVIQNK